MKKVTTVLSMIVVSMLLMSSALYAQNGNMKGMNKQKNMSSYHGQNYSQNYQQNSFQNIPDITDTQKEQLKTIRTKMMKESLPLKNQLMEQKTHLNTISTIENPDIKAINKQIDLIGKTKTEMMKKRASFRQDVRKVLTDDQRVFFDTHSGQMKGKGHHKGNRQRMNCSKRY